MNSLDYHYFDTLDQADGPFYDWERQLINIPFTSEAILSKDETTVSREEFSKLVHEYIHFLQNFATTWGAPVFTDFSLAIMKIGASSVEDTNKIKLPLVVKDLENDLLREGFELRAFVNERVIRFDAASFHHNAALTAISQLPYNADGVTLTNGRVTAQIGIKHIREHMAHIGTQLFLGKSDNDIHEFNKNFRSFCDGGISFSQQSEYWILYEYLFELNTFSELSTGVFYLAQQCLTTLSPEKALARFFQWLNANAVQPQTTSLVSAVDKWRSSFEETTFFTDEYSKAVSHCRNILRMCANHSDNDLFVFTAAITNYALNNIINTQGGKTLFSPPDNFTSIAYWKSKIVRHGTGLVKFQDTVLMIGSTPHIKAMQDSFNFLVASSLAVKKLVENRIRICPFLYDIPICTASYREEDTCLTNPFLTAPRNGGYCLFGNGVELTKLRDRTDFTTMV